MDDDRDWADARHVRVYQSLRGDPKFARLWASIGGRGAYLTVLMDADAVWPQPASLSAILPRGAISDLIDAGVIVLVPGRQYTLPALDKERRAQASRFGNGPATDRRHREGARPQYPSDLRRRSASTPQSDSASDSAAAPQSESASTPHRSASRTRVGDGRGRGNGEYSAEEYGVTSPAGAREALRNGVDLALWGQVAHLAEELTGRAHALANPYGGLGAMALDQAVSTGFAATEAAYRQVAGVIGQPTARQLVFDAETILRPTGLASGESKQARAGREKRERRQALGLPEEE